MTIYKSKRLNYGLSLDQMARYMELPYEIYKKLDEGKDLEGEEKMFEKLVRKIGIQKVEELDKEKATNLKLEDVGKTYDINEFYENFNKQEMFKKFNIISYFHLSQLLEKKYSPDTIATYLNYKHRAKESFRKEIYNFFSNEKNIQDPKRAVKCVKRGNKIIESELDENQRWFNTNFDTMKMDIANLVNNGQIMGSQLKFCKEYGLNNTVLSKVLNRKENISKHYAEVLRNALEPKEEVTLYANQRNSFTTQDNSYITTSEDIEPSTTTNMLINNEISRINEENVNKFKNMSIANEELLKINRELREENEKLKSIVSQLSKEQLLELILR